MCSTILYRVCAGDVIEGILVPESRPKTLRYLVLYRAFLSGIKVTAIAFSPLRISIIY